MTRLIDDNTLSRGFNLAQQVIMKVKGQCSDSASALNVQITNNETNKNVSSLSSESNQSVIKNDVNPIGQVSQEQKRAINHVNKEKVQFQHVSQKPFPKIDIKIFPVYLSQIVQELYNSQFQNNFQLFQFLETIDKLKIFQKLSDQFSCSLNEVREVYNNYIIQFFVPVSKFKDQIIKLYELNQNMGIFDFQKQLDNELHQQFHIGELVEFLNKYIHAQPLHHCLDFFEPFVGLTKNQDYDQLLIQKKLFDQLLVGTMKQLTNQQNFPNKKEMIIEMSKLNHEQIILLFEKVSLYMHISVQSLYYYFSYVYTTEIFTNIALFQMEISQLIQLPENSNQEPLFYYLIIQKRYPEHAFHKFNSLTLIQQLQHELPKDQPLIKQSDCQLRSKLHQKISQSIFENAVREYASSQQRQLTTAEDIRSFIEIQPKAQKTEVFNVLSKIIGEENNLVRNYYESYYKQLFTEPLDSYIDEILIIIRTNPGRKVADYSLRFRSLHKDKIFHEPSLARVITEQIRLYQTGQ